MQIQILVSFQGQANVISNNEEKRPGMPWELRSLLITASPGCSRRARVKCSCPSPQRTPDTGGVHVESGYDVGIHRH